MSYYGHAYKEEISQTPLGKGIVTRENNFFISLLRKYLSKNDSSLLEIGAGKGGFAEACRRLEPWNYVGVEANVEQTARLQQSNFNVQSGLVPPIPFADDSFDAVFANQVIEHMPSADKVIALATEIYRVLKPGGIVFIGAPDYFIYKEGFFDNDYTHNYVTTVARITQLLEDHDFKILHQDYMVLSLRGRYLTFFVSQLARFIYWTRLPYLFLSYKRAQKIRYTLLRGFFILGQKC